MDDLLMINEELFGVLLDGNPNWSANPEHFIDFVRLVDLCSQAMTAGSLQEKIRVSKLSDDLAKLLIQEFNVEISPYKDYEQLKRFPISKSALLKKLDMLLDKSRADDLLFDLTEEVGIRPSFETIVKEIAEDFQTQAVIDRLRPHVFFY